MTIFCEPRSRSIAAAARHPRDLIVMHDGGGDHGGHGGHGGGWDGFGPGGGGNWVAKILVVLIVAYIVLTGLGVIGR